MTFRSLLRGALVASTLLSAPAAFAQALVGGTVLNGSVPAYNVNASAPFTIDQGTLGLRVFVVNGSGGGGGGGSSGPSYVGQYNSTLPTFVSGQTGYLSVDNSGRLLVAPTSSILADLRIGGAAVGSSNPVPISGQVTNTGTFAVQNTAPVVGGNTTPVKTDGSGATQPISATALPLPTGAATSANQSSEIAALGTTADTAYAGSGTTSIIAGLKGIYTATLAPLAAGTNTIGSIANISGTVSLPTGAATSALQSTEINSATFNVETLTPLAANSGVTASSRLSAASGSANHYTYFVCEAYSNQAGTLFVEGSNDNTNFYPRNGAAGASVTAGSTQNVRVPVMYPYNRCRYFNGATANTVFSLSSGYTRF